jgi:protoheme IX farnesyltransferase
VLAGVAAAVATSLYTLRKMTDEAIWKMYKTSSPILALFLIVLILH